MKKILILKFSIYILFIFTLSSISCSKKMDSTVMAYSPFEGTALVWIAEDRGFFKQNGIEVEYKRYDTGSGALDGVVDGEADIVSGTTTFPLVIKALEGVEISTIGAIDRVELIYIVGRKDRGINNASDLRGKVVGTTYGTIAEFYLGRFLEINRMDLNDIIVVDLKTPDEWVNSVVNGDIDAVCTAQPYVFYTTELLGNNATVLPAQYGQYLMSHLIAGNDWITDNPEMIKRLLKSLLQAEQYAINNPGEAKIILEKYLELDRDYVETVWPKNQLSLSLENSLVLAMEEQARWIIKNNLTDKKEIPDFLDYIHEMGLMLVKPEAVNLISSGQKNNEN